MTGLPIKRLSPWLDARTPKCRVSGRQPGDRIDSSAVACLTPNKQRLRVGVLIGSSDRESSVVLSLDQARDFARSILSICGSASLNGLPDPFVAEALNTERAAASSEIRTGECPCGGTWGVCPYHGGGPG